MRFIRPALLRELQYWFSDGLLHIYRSSGPIPFLLSFYTQGHTFIAVRMARMMKPSKTAYGFPRRGRDMRTNTKRLVFV